MKNHDWSMDASVYPMEIIQIFMRSLETEHFPAHFIPPFSFSSSSITSSTFFIPDYIGQFNGQSSRSTNLKR